MEQDRIIGVEIEAFIQSLKDFLMYLYRAITFLFNLGILSSSIFGSLESPPLPPGLGALK